MKILELEELLPRLNEGSKDVDIWAEEFLRLMKLANISNPASLHTWATECVEGKLRGVLQDLVKVNKDGEEEFPTMKEIKEALEEALEVTPQEKCKRLQRLKIKKGESIKNFNWKYKKLYSNLPRLYQTFITVDDYLESISYRPYARAQVITQRCDDLEEAFEEAELAERAEGRRFNKSDTVMTTIYNSEVYSIHSLRNSEKHPFKQFYGNYINHNVNNKSVNSKKNEYNKIISTKNKDQYQEQQINNMEKRSIKQFKCFKCNQVGHGIKQCPYSYKELAELEEKGKLKESFMDPLN